MSLTEVGGDNLGEPITHVYLMPVQREVESGVFIMPYGEILGEGPIVQTPRRNCTVADLLQMFLDLRRSQPYEL